MKQQLIIAFPTTTAALKAEEVCHEKDIPGRLIPVPADIKADCGLAWRTDPENRQIFEKAAEGILDVSGYYLRQVRF